MTQAESYEPFWRAHRDNWKPCTPDDVHGLAEDRTFTPPSKAHLKRIARFRPVVTAPDIRPVLDNSRRREINQARAASAGVREAIARAKSKEFLNV